MEQAKALNALEPFVALAKSATSPRAAADLVARATSAPNTFVFTELLDTPQIQALDSSPKYRAHLALLRIFSHGTYKTYRLTPGLPSLTDAQTIKLRQLSLLTLARDPSNLSYAALQEALGLVSARELEDLVIKAVYQGLLHATLDPARQAVQVTSISPLRDPPPGAVPGIVSALNDWDRRCDATLGDLEDHIRNIRAGAATRAREAKAADDKLTKLLSELREPDSNKTELLGGDSLPRRALNKRSMLEEHLAADDTMDLDEPYLSEEHPKRASKRKI